MVKGRSFSNILDFRSLSLRNKMNGSLIELCNAFDNLYDVRQKGAKSVMFQLQHNSVFPVHAPNY